MHIDVNKEVDNSVRVRLVPEGRQPDELICCNEFVPGEGKDLADAMESLLQRNLGKIEIGANSIKIVDLCGDRAGTPCFFEGSSPDEAIMNMLKVLHHATFGQAVAA